MLPCNERATCQKLGDPSGGGENNRHALEMPVNGHRTDCTIITIINWGLMFVHPFAIAPQRHQRSAMCIHISPAAAE